jgi:hypothetical protein
MNSKKGGSSRLRRSRRSRRSSDFNNRNNFLGRNLSGRNTRRRGEFGDYDETAREKSGLNNLKLGDKEPDAESKEEEYYTCINKSYPNCGKGCRYRGWPGFGGKCVPKPLDNMLACHNRDPARCVYPCRTYNSTGSKSRPNCTHFPIKNVQEIDNYVKEILRTKDTLIEYHQILSDKNEEIQKWIEDSKHKLTKEEIQQVAAVETLKRNQVIYKDPEEKADVSKKLKEEEIALENIRSNIIDLDDLLRQIVTLYVADKGKNKLLENKVQIEEEMIDSKEGRMNNRRLGRGSSSSSRRGLGSLSRGRFANDLNMGSLRRSSRRRSSRRGGSKSKKNKKNKNKNKK